FFFGRRASNERTPRVRPAQRPDEAGLPFGSPAFDTATRPYRCVITKPDARGYRATMSLTAVTPQTTERTEREGRR
ncbi:hypothetical protein, partial [Halorubrum sp. Atlit-28R]|uniref:hypothetical protein n=1 Tax=Halorubrum sp. Atlit-28R TaxID=2282129 RepID=UPI001F2BB472